MGSVPLEKLGAAVGAVPSAAWAPTVDGKILPRHPFDPDAPAISAHVPVLVGSNLNPEMVNGVDNPDVDSFAEADLTKRLSQQYGANTQRIVDAYRREYPGATPWNLFAAISASDQRR